MDIAELDELLPFDTGEVEMALRQTVLEQLTEEEILSIGFTQEQIRQCGWQEVSVREWLHNGFRAQVESAVDFYTTPF